MAALASDLESSVIVVAVDIVDQCSAEIQKVVPFCYIADFNTSDDRVEPEMKGYLSRDE